MSGISNSLDFTPACHDSSAPSDACAMTQRVGDKTVSSPLTSITPTGTDREILHFKGDYDITAYSHGSTRDLVTPTVLYKERALGNLFSYGRLWNELDRRPLRTRDRHQQLAQLNQWAFNGEWQKVIDYLKSHTENPSLLGTNPTFLAMHVFHQRAWEQLPAVLDILSHYTQEQGEKEVDTPGRTQDIKLLTYHGVKVYSLPSTNSSETAFLRLIQATRASSLGPQDKIRLFEQLEVALNQCRQGFQEDNDDRRGFIYYATRQLAGEWIALGQFDRAVAVMGYGNTHVSTQLDGIYGKAAAGIRLEDALFLVTAELRLPAIPWDNIEALLSPMTKAQRRYILCQLSLPDAQQVATALKNKIEKIEKLVPYSDRQIKFYTRIRDQDPTLAHLIDAGTLMDHLDTVCRSRYWYDVVNCLVLRGQAKTALKIVQTAHAQDRLDGRLDEVVGGSIVQPLIDLGKIGKAISVVLAMDSVGESTWLIGQLIIDPFVEKEDIASALRIMDQLQRAITKDPTRLASIEVGKMYLDYIVSPLLKTNRELAFQSTLRMPAVDVHDPKMNRDQVIAGYFIIPLLNKGKTEEAVAFALRTPEPVKFMIEQMVDPLITANQPTVATEVALQLPSGSTPTSSDVICDHIVTPLMNKQNLQAAIAAALLIPDEATKRSVLAEAIVSPYLNTAPNERETRSHILKGRLPEAYHDLLPAAGTDPSTSIPAVE